MIFSTHSAESRIQVIGDGETGEKKGLGEYGNVVPSPEFTGGLKTDRKAKQINFCVLKGTKHSYLYIIYKYMPAAY